MKRIAVAVALQGRQLKPRSNEVEAVAHRAGLAVHRAIHDRHRWAVTHVSSGLAFTTQLRSRNSAIALRSALLELGLDFEELDMASVLRHANLISPLIVRAHRSPEVTP